MLLYVTQLIALKTLGFTESVCLPNAIVGPVLDLKKVGVFDSRIRHQVSSPRLESADFCWRQDDAALSGIALVPHRNVSVSGNGREKSADAERLVGVVKPECWFIAALEKPKYDIACYPRGRCFPVINEVNYSAKLRIHFGIVKVDLHFDPWSLVLPHGASLLV